MDPSIVFKPIPGAPEGLHRKLFLTFEAIAIRLWKSELCKERRTTAVIAMTVICLLQSCVYGLSGPSLFPHFFIFLLIRAFVFHTYLSFQAAPPPNVSPWSSL